MRKSSDNRDAPAHILAHMLKHLAFEAGERLHGEANYSYRKLSGLGLIISSLSSFVLFFMLTDKFLLSNEKGFTSLAFVVVGNVILTGTTLTVLGIMSLYLRKVYEETQGRPLYVLRDKKG